jgi:hypothetical protein
VRCYRLDYTLLTIHYSLYSLEVVRALLQVHTVLTHCTHTLYSHTVLIHYTHTLYSHTVRALLQAGADPNAMQTETMHTALGEWAPPSLQPVHTVV